MSYSKKPKTIDPDKVDPSIYYYDEVYDEMKEDEEGQRKDNQRDGKTNLNEPRTSKYIQGLQETANLRKTEKELRRFRKYARDREEAEKDLDLNNEDIYITDGYKRKLKDMKLLEEDKRRRLEDEKDNTMNFLKIFKSDIVKQTNDINEQELVPNEKETINLKSQETKDDETVSPMQGPQLILKPKRELKTLKERREYLRKFLAKRTVGKVFDEAVKRYKERRYLEKASVR